MSLLSLCQDVTDVVGIPRPTAIITGADQISRQLLGFAKEAIEELATMDWPMTNLEYPFQTVVGQAAYPVPTDFFKIVTDTAYLASQYYILRGSLTAGDWQRQRNALPAQIGRYKFRLYGSPMSIVLTPAPGTVENIVLEYVSLNRVIKADGTPLPTWTNDTDVAVYQEDLIKKSVKWRLKNAKGLDYAEDFDDCQVCTARALAQALGLGSQVIAYRRTVDVPELSDGYVPEYGYGP